MIYDFGVGQDHFTKPSPVLSQPGNAATTTHLTLASPIPSQVSWNTPSIGLDITLTLLAPIPSQAQWRTPTIIVGAPDALLYIAGHEWAWEANTFVIDLNLSGSSNTTFNIRYRGESNKPYPGNEIVFYWRGVKRFGGFITTVEENMQPGVYNESTLVITCNDYNSILGRVIIAKLYTLPIGTLISIILIDIVQRLLSQFGITYTFTDDPFTSVGVILFHYITVQEAFNEMLKTAPGWSIWIDSNKVLHFEKTSGIGVGATAPFSVDNTTPKEAIQVIKDNSKFANSVWVLPNSDLTALQDDQFIGDGSTRGFFTQYVPSVTPTVKVNGVNTIVAVLGLPFPSVWDWYFIVGGQGVFQNPSASPLTALDTLDVEYPSPFPLAVNARDDVSIAAVGLFEIAYQATTVNDLVTAQALAEGLLEIYEGADGYVESVQYLTYDTTQIFDWLTPGMVVEMDTTYPTLAGLYTVQEVQSTEADLVLFRHQVTLSKNGADVTEALALQVALTNTRVPIYSPPYLATFELFQGSPPNPAFSTGLITNSFVVQVPAAVIAYWDILFNSGDEPTGASVIIDITLNGVSIFPFGGPYMESGDGVVGITTGIQFAANNIIVNFGDVIRLNVLQVGSTNPGQNAVAHLGMRV